jgi:hypothetical protein
MVGGRCGELNVSCNCGKTTAAGQQVD